MVAAHRPMSSACHLGTRGYVDSTGSAIIDFTEACYDFELSDDEWLPTLIARGLPILDHGLGVAAVEYGRPPDEGDVRVLRIHVGSGPADFPDRHMAALQATPPEMLREQARPGQATTMSHSTAAHPEALELYTSHVDYCKDVFGITAVDSKGAGVAIVAPLMADYFAESKKATMLETCRG